MSKSASCPSKVRKITWIVSVCGMFFLALVLPAAEVFNHAGRILAPTVPVTTPILFNTTQADQVLAGMQIMPRDNPWNEDISSRPVHGSSAAIIGRIYADLASNRKALQAFQEMNFSLVPDNQARVRVRLIDYPDESDDVITGTSDGNYPFPGNLPVETWPVGVPGMSLSDWQIDVNGDGGDRHAIAVQAGTGLFWETWQSKRTPTGPTVWQASNGARFNLQSNTLRPDGWTSGDAAGLPLFPALVRYDEVQRGEIEHALRLIVRVSRRSYIYPATHFASSLNDADLPAMGQRLRLKASFAIPGTWTRESRLVAQALKRYGGLVADNGGFFSLSVTPDDRWPTGCFDALRALTVQDFEVIQSTGINEGPRSGGVPTVNAGADRQAQPGQSLSLSAVASGNNLSYSWYLYPLVTAPGTAVFQSAGQAMTNVTFSAVGEYLVVIRVTDTIHAPVYDVVRVQVDAQSRNIRIGVKSGSTGLSVNVIRDAGAESQDTDGNGEVFFSNLSSSLNHIFSFLQPPLGPG